MTHHLSIEIIGNRLTQTAVKYYVYQQKVAVTMNGDNDSLDVRTGKYRDNWLNKGEESNKNCGNYF